MFEYDRPGRGAQAASLATLAALTVVAAVAVVAPATAARPAATTAPLSLRIADSNALLKAVRDGDLGAVRSALAQGTDVNFADGDDHRRTPLMIAAGLGRADLVEALLAAGADVNSRDRSGRTALHLILAELEPKPAKKKRGGGFGLGSSLGSIGKSLGVDRVARQADGLLRGALGSGVLNRGVGRSLLSGGLSTLLTGPGAVFQMADPRHWNTLVGAALVGDERAALEGLTNFDAKDADSWVGVLRPAAKGQPELLRTMESVAEASDPATQQQWAAFLKAAGRGDANAVRQILNDPRIAPLLGAAGDGIRTAADALPGRDGGVSVAKLLLAGGANVGATDEQGKTPASRARGAGLAEVADLLEASATTLP